MCNLETKVNFDLGHGADISRWQTLSCLNALMPDDAYIWSLKGGYHLFINHGLMMNTAAEQVTSHYLKIFIGSNAFKNVVCEKASILSGLQFVKHTDVTYLLHLALVNWFDVDWRNLLLTTVKCRYGTAQCDNMILSTAQQWLNPGTTRYFYSKLNLVPDAVRHEYDIFVWNLSYTMNILMG